MDIFCRSAAAVEPARTAHALDAGWSFYALSASRANFSLNTSNASRALYSLWSLDLAASHPGAGGKVPHLK